MGLLDLTYMNWPVATWITMSVKIFRMHRLAELTNERKNTTHNTNAERQALRLPFTHIKKSGEELLRVALGSKYQQRYQDGKEAQDVQHQKRAFELGKQPSSGDIDEDAEADDGPVYQCDVPVLRDVCVRSAQHYKTLDKATSEKGPGSKGSQPTAQRQPTRDVAKQFLRTSGCEH